MDIINLPIAEIRPYEKNPRINDAGVKKVTDSIKEFGFNQPIVVDGDNVIIAGHTRFKAAKALGLKEVPVLVAGYLTAAQVQAYRIADNRVAQESEWDNALLFDEILDLKGQDFDLSLTGFDEDELENILNPTELEPGLIEDDECPEVAEDPVTKLGDIWKLGCHRVMCGDSTSIDDAERLMDGKKSRLLHADPPYGMKKEKDGVLNDDLTNEDLDRFQMEWWATFRPFITNNASAYIWGNAPELWRLWYTGGLKETKELTVINEIVWAKVHSGGSYDAIGQSSDLLRCYPCASERCLFLMLGDVDFNNNSDNYWDGWESVRSYLEDVFKKSGLTRKRLHEITEVQMYAHWFTKSQWCFITEKAYNLIAKECNGKAFIKPYDELKKEYLGIKKKFDDEIMSEFYASRPYFDNSHANMSEVWNFEKVRGDDRHGHATPKPVEMMERIVKSSSEKNDVVIEPFAGSGSTLIACEKTGRLCYTMELSPQYCDVVVKRWQNFTGKKATLESTGQKFDELLESL